MRYLLLSSSLFILFGCSSPYKHLQKTTGDINAIDKFKPIISVVLYKAEIDVMGNYLGGLLLIKKMPDSSTRMLFSNEMGFKFFDFEFAADGSFKVFYVLKKLDRKAVVKTLKKDFELVLMQRLDTSNAFIRSDSIGLRYYVFPQSKGYNCYITDSTGTALIRMERASKRKAVVTVITNNYTNGLPDTIGITHHKFDFTIGLKKIER
ncbi:MAG: hypothetical protein ABIN36_09620 [Ferruginibacter sp.]